MYVCLCHGFTDRQVRAAITEGAGNANQVFRQFNAKPRCGKCVSTVRELVDETKGSGGTSGGCPCGKRN
ncbi:bfd domain-containing protein (2fe-2S)-binding domain-containing protein [Paramagnetospirillum kuznetsovii]|uniref:Bacterioferritin-associated ferredoxin n=1 Tax=Paramagnetospirillum kuznetsovii TaxID=2053833 RepID=A0A364NVA1_9PROT|nr:(2Fe-2S)-binding protein [Paramagnetospirillum kuznetsovii]RAU20983.1 bfd domain-containing protein (2fe-2S)-binding domain-containing protein [Paramagnetospirillum kuznetsovii]